MLIIARVEIQYLSTDRALFTKNLQINAFYEIELKSNLRGTDFQIGSLIRAELVWRVRDSRWISTVFIFTNK